MKNQDRQIPIDVGELNFAIQRVKEGIKHISQKEDMSDEDVKIINGLSVACGLFSNLANGSFFLEGQRKHKKVLLELYGVARAFKFKCLVPPDEMTFRKSEFEDLFNNNVIGSDYVWRIDLYPNKKWRISNEADSNGLWEYVIIGEKREVD